MKTNSLLLCGILLGACSSLPEASYSPQSVTEFIHGIPVTDPHRWLEDAKNPTVQQWMKREDLTARSILGQLPEREALVKRFRELFYVDSVSTPLQRGERLFYLKRASNQEQSALYVRDGLSGAERVLIDPNTWDPALKLSLGRFTPSWSGKLLAYHIKQNNADESEMRILEVDTAQELKIDRISGAKYARANFTPDDHGFYYTFLPESSDAATRPGRAEIRYHRIGTEQSRDPVIYSATGDPKKFLTPSLSRDGRWLQISISSGWAKNEIFIKDLSKPESAFTPFFVGKDAQMSIVAWKEHFYLLTNDGASRFKLLRAPAGSADPSTWTTLIPESKTAVLEDFAIAGDQLLLVWMENVHHKLERRTLTGESPRSLKLSGLGSISGLSAEPDQSRFFYAFESFTTPSEIHTSDIRTLHSEIWHRLKAPIDPTPYTVEQKFFRSRDGTRVPMFIVRAKTFIKNGKTPFQLYGYGGFSVSETPSFRAGYFPTLEAGGAYAIVNLRGGGEFGEQWHRGGMLLNKQNTFDDFIAAAETLIREKYTSSDRLAIRGGSNGGLLVGAAITQRPDLFRAAVCSVPLLDMIRYPLFGSGKTWIPEYGDPEDPDHFRALYSYSPYHRVRSGTHYPAVLMDSADSDDRVDPMHARKMIAALRDANRSEHPILLRLEANAGHGGAGRVNQAVERAAEISAFVFHELGLKAARNPKKHQ
jgi:prolyl oligopeptidase